MKYSYDSERQKNCQHEWVKKYAFWHGHSYLECIHCQKTKSVHE